MLIPENHFDTQVYQYHLHTQQILPYETFPPGIIIKSDHISILQDPNSPFEGHFCSMSRVEFHYNTYPTYEMSKWKGTNNKELQHPPARMNSPFLSKFIRHFPILC